MTNTKNMTDSDWKKKLTAEEFHVLREKGTENRGGKYSNFNKKGMYVCGACGHELFLSSAKFELNKSDPNYGWPSFDQPANLENVELIKDDRFGMNRTEVICRNCKSHLGHVFDDGPKETTGRHYCINSCALNFKSENDNENA